MLLVLLAGHPVGAGLLRDAHEQRRGASPWSHRAPVRQPFCQPTVGRRMERMHSESVAWTRLQPQPFFYSTAGSEPHFALRSTALCFDGKGMRR